MIVRCPLCNAQFTSPAEVCSVDGGLLEPVHDQRVGRVLSGRYRVDELIGVGGMASVYRARHLPTGRDVALKVLDRSVADDPVIVQRFAREARAARVMRHPSIVPVNDVGEDAGVMFLAMDLLVGEMLADRVGRGPIDPSEVVEILLPIASALAYAHSLGVVHRDIKPENVFLCDERMGARVRVLDFGIAHLAEANPLTGAGEILGTPAYMSPELARGLECSPASDLYSLGVMAFEMLSGRLPFEGSGYALMVKHVHEDPPALAALAPQVPARLAALVMALLAKSPSGRPSCGEDVTAELTRIQATTRA